jgi:isopenicillin-N N-acyltransferase like protein
MMQTKKNVEAPIHETPPPLLYISGTHREMGQQIGEARRVNIQHSVETARKLFSQAYGELDLTWEGAQIQASKYLPFSQERYPQYVDEMQGIAEGANVSFEDIIVLNALEAVTADALHLMRCTSMGVNEQRTSDGHVLVAHNEDWIPDDESDVFVIHAKPNEEPPYLAMTYGGLIANVGMNAYGIAQLINSVHPNDSRIGIPRIVVSRAVLASKTPGGALHHALIPHRAAGYHHLLAHESGEIYSVEVSARRFSVLYNEDGFIAHTNHYLSANMQKIEENPEELISSRIRYFRALRLLSQSRSHTVETLQDIQRDHVNYPNSICKHDFGEENLLDSEKTINALVMDLTTREMHIAWGNPCKNIYHTYSLNG